LFIYLIIGYFNNNGLKSYAGAQYIVPLQYFYYCCLLVFAFSLKKRDIIVMTSREVMPSAKNFPEESIFYTYPKGMDFHKRKR